MNNSEDKLGVFICDCGDKVAGILNIEVLMAAVEELPAVVCVEHAPYWCSADGRERLQAIIRAEDLKRVVVAGCNLRTHQRLFQETVAGAELDPGLLGLVNIREGCAWPHRTEPEAATARARDQIEMEVLHTCALSPCPPIQTEITPAVLIIGGGVAGMTAALELADNNIPVTLVERKVALGGKAINYNFEFVPELIVAVQSHPEIDLQLNSRITHIDGSVGSYHVAISPSTGECHGPFGAIIVATGVPDEETSDLAGMLYLTQDTGGFLPEWRVRLRPDRYIERGIYVCGAVHYPCDLAEAQFQACSVASRVLRHLGRGTVTAHGPVARIAPDKCNGCSECRQVCPFAAVTMIERSNGLPQRPGPAERLSLSEIDPLLCTGCGNCVSICPVGAITIPGWTDTQLEAQIRVALGGQAVNGRMANGEGANFDQGAPAPERNNDPRVLIFACEWSGYAAAELAGARDLIYPSRVRMIRLDCSGRLQPGLILKAFEMGAAGVLLLGCPPKMCHYERGNERLAGAYEQLEALTGLLGLTPRRLKLAWVPPDDGPAFAQVVSEFVRGCYERLDRSKNEVAP